MHPILQKPLWLWIKSLLLETHNSWSMKFGMNHGLHGQTQLGMSSVFLRDKWEYMRCLQGTDSPCQAAGSSPSQQAPVSIFLHQLGHSSRFAMLSHTVTPLLLITRAGVFQPCCQHSKKPGAQWVPSDYPKPGQHGKVVFCKPPSTSASGPTGTSVDGRQNSIPRLQAHSWAVRGNSNRSECEPLWAGTVFCANLSHNVKTNYFRTAIIAPHREIVRCWN